MNASALQAAVLASVVISALVAGCGPAPTPRTSAPTSTTSAPTSALTSIVPDATFERTVSCTPDPGPLPSAVAGDPCPDAIVAVSAAVAPVRLPIVRMVVEPGPFFCDIVWPGVGSYPPCYGPAVAPGQFMHGWVTFRGSDEIAAVALGRDLPTLPAASASPWRSTLVRVEVPPPGWVMP